MKTIQLDWSQVCDAWKDELERLWSQNRRDDFHRMVEFLIRTQEPNAKSKKENV
jgi:hypothetical protein